MLIGFVLLVSSCFNDSCDALPIEMQPKTFPAKRWLSYYVRQIDKEIRGQL